MYIKERYYAVNFVGNDHSFRVFCHVGYLSNHGRKYPNKYPFVRPSVFASVRLRVEPLFTQISDRRPLSGSQLFEAIMSAVHKIHNANYCTFSHTLCLYFDYNI